MHLLHTSGNKRSPGHLRLITFSHSNILHAIQYRAFISLFAHFFVWEMLLYISNMLISLCKKYFFYFLTEIMWMYKVRVGAVRADCWLCYIVLTLCVPIAWLRKWMNDNVNILKRSGSMLLIHNWQWVLTNYVITKKEKSSLEGTEKLCGPEMDFCLRLVSLYRKGKNLTWLRSALASICNTWFALLRFAYDMKLIWENNF